MRPAARVARGLVFLLLLLVGLPALWIALAGWNWARPVLEWHLERVTGREVEIAGGLDVQLGRHPRVSAERVRFGNPAWSSQPHLFTAEHLAVRLPLLPMLVGRFRLEELEVEGARARFERARDGTGNWLLRRPLAAVTPARVELPPEVRVRDSVLEYRDPRRALEFVARFDALDAGANEDVVRTRARGRFQERPFAVRGVVEGALSRDDRPVRVDVRAAVGGTRVHLDGVVADLERLEGVDAELAIAGPSLDELWPLLGLPLPESPRYRIHGQLRRSGREVRLDDFAGVLGSSDIAGDLAFRYPAEGRRSIVGHLRSKSLDLDDVEGFWARPVREEDGAGAVPAAARRAGGPASVFPDRRFDFAKLRAFDARIGFAAGRIQGRTLLDAVELDLRLDRGRLELAPLEFGMSGGRLTSHAVIDARGEVAELTAEVALARLDLGRLLQELDLEQRAAGTFGGRAELVSRGNSLHQMAAGLDGEIGVVLERGALSREAIEWLALDLAEALIERSRGPQLEPIRCLVGVFDARDGRLDARTLLMDTELDRVTGEGTIDLAREQLDLELRQHPKDFSIGSLRTPIEIEGSFAERRARPQKKGLLARGGAAVALGALIHPAAALLALVEVGDGDQPGACAKAFAEYRPIARGLGGLDRGTRRAAKPAARERSRGGRP